MHTTPINEPMTQPINKTLPKLVHVLLNLPVNTHSKTENMISMQRKESMIDKNAIKKIINKSIKLV
ncbi:hypothetical protein HHZ40_000161 [Salmonella enterica]|nr:hypothetical protein [Salmonella enterica]